MDGNNMNYQNNTYQQPAPAQPGKGFGIASMVLGIIALLITLLSCCLPFLLILSGLLGLLSIVFGIIAIAKKGGKGMGIAGLICSGIGLLLAIVILIFSILVGAGLMAMPAFMEEYEDYYYDNYYYDYDYDDYDYDDYDYDYDYDYDDWDY